MSGKELTPEELEELKNRHIRSFVLRRGHISVAQERAFEEIFPKYEVKYEAKPFDDEAAFGRKAPLVLEIGCGMGETTAAIAQAHPEVNFLGCEVFVAGVGALSKRIDEMGLENIRIARHDAVEVVRDMLAPDSLSGSSPQAPSDPSGNRFAARLPPAARRLYPLRHRLGKLRRTNARSALVRTASEKPSSGRLLSGDGQSLVRASLHQVPGPRRTTRPRRMGSRLRAHLNFPAPSKKAPARLRPVGVFICKALADQAIVIMRLAGS